MWHYVSNLDRDLLTFSTILKLPLVLIKTLSRSIRVDCAHFFFPSQTSSAMAETGPLDRKFIAEQVEQTTSGNYVSIAFTALFLFDIGEIFPIPTFLVKLMIV